MELKAVADCQTADIRPSTGGNPVWLTLTDEPMYAVLHEPESRHRNTAVLMVPAFGWDEACSYRARRQWASAYAEAGFSTVRFDLPGSEDSIGSPLAPARFASWIEAVGAITEWLRRTADADRLVAVGLGLGALIACEAVDAGARIDDLVLWGARARGGQYLREMSMYANAMASERNKRERPDGAFDIGGYPLSKESGEAITGASGLLENPSGHRVLLIERDAHGVDAALQAHLAEGGAEVTVLPTDEYTAMMTFPDTSQPPRKTIAAAVSWLDDHSAPRSTNQPPMHMAPEVALEISFEYDGKTIRERHARFATDAGDLLGILSEPAGATREQICLISHNSGALRRTGQCRMWTDMCRRWAARGVPALRFDLDGVGDSPGLFEPNREREDEPRVVAERMAIADALERDQIASRFVSIGLCLAAYWEFKVALADSRLMGTVLINQFAFDATSEQERERTRRWALAPLRYALRPQPGRPGLLSQDSLHEVARGLWFTILGAFSAARRSQLAPAIAQFDLLTANGTRLLLLFGETEVLYRQMLGLGMLKMLSRWPQIKLEELPTNDHDLRPLHIQEMVNERLDRFVTEVLLSAKAEQ